MLDLRIFRSFHAKYYEDDILQGPTAYPEEYFAQVAEHGFNAVWMRGILRDLAPTDVFPTLGTEVAAHQDALGTVVERAKRHGVQVLLYLNEPLCLPRAHPFWAEHPEVRGVAGHSEMDEWPETYAFCTSTPEMRAWLYQVTHNLFRDVPELGGWFAISAGEHHAHCYSYIFDLPNKQQLCPRCAERSAVDVVTELLTLMHNGTKAARPSAHTIAWNWAWTVYEPDPQASLIAGLPADMNLLIDWERGGYRTMPNGKQNFVDEYSLMYVGPSERFRKLYDVAQERGLSVMAKLQVGTTHELSTAPNLPLIDHLYEKLVRAELLGLKGVQATWNFGNSFSLNTAAVGRFVRTPERPSPDVFVTQLAEEYLGVAHGEAVASAVTQFSRAMEYYPFDVPLIYFGPNNYAAAYHLSLAPLTGKEMGWSWMMHERGDTLPAGEQFTIDEIIDLLSRLVPEWEQGVALYAEALAGSTSPQAAIELGAAAAVGHMFRSTLNVYKTFVLRRDRPADLAAQYRPILEDEIANLDALLPLAEADPRIGFHAECQAWMVSPELLRNKLADMHAQLAALEITV